MHSIYRGIQRKALPGKGWDTLGHCNPRSAVEQTTAGGNASLRCSWLVKLFRVYIIDKMLLCSFQIEVVKGITNIRGLIKHTREILGIKQDALAFELGLSQQAVSQMEQKEKLEPELLQKVESQLRVPVEAIKNFNEEMAIQVIANTLHGNSVNNVNYQCTFNPIDKIVELYDAF